MRPLAGTAPWRAFSSALVCAAYLLTALAPCPPTPGAAPRELAHADGDRFVEPVSAPHVHPGQADHAAHGVGAAHPPSRAAHTGDRDTASLTAPCLCGCDGPGPGAGAVKRLGATLLPEQPDPLPFFAMAWPSESAVSHPDRPAPVDPPVPLSA